MRVLILTPISVEHKAILANLTSPVDKIVEGSRYVSGDFLGKHGKVEVFTQQTGSGNSTIALATEKAIRNIQPMVIILAGIAGGVKDVAIGDVVVGTKFYGYESGKETETGFVVRPEAGSYSKDLLAIAQSVAGNDRWKNRVPAGAAAAAKVIFGPIASGDKVVAANDGTIARLLKQSFNDTTALEMESNGFGQAMQYHPGIRFINIRGVSDLLGGKSKSDAEGSQERASANMAAFIFELLDQIDDTQFKFLGMELKELTKQLVETTLPIIQMEASGQDYKSSAGEPLVVLWQKVKELLASEYEALKNAPDDADTKAEARLALKLALEGKSTLQAGLEALLHEAKKSGDSGVSISNSKNVIQGSNITVGGDLRIGDDNTRQDHKSTDAVGGDKYVQSADHIQINHYYGKDATPAPGMGIPAKQTVASDYIQSLQHMIASGRAEAAIQSVIDYTASRDEEAHLEVLQISSRWKDMSRKVRLGTIRNDEANVERSQIVAGLLELVGRL
ncbi:MAG: 5'-methylthioadenosine/S-adenosylhomocysteine nucleosidase [Saprospiraceae bacterium]|nr:5'-methylthioadenosine/S-adenosylhomocysteine nucleosidase [Saprospiraceae bacterium]